MTYPVEIPQVKHMEKEETLPRILATYPISESRRWQKETVFLAAKKVGGLLGVLNRLLKPFGFRDITLPLRLFRMRSAYDVIITGAEREDCSFALLQTFFAMKKTHHFMTCCLWKREPNPFVYWLKRTLLRLMSRSVTRFIVWSTDEVEGYSRYFGIDRRKFIFLPHHATLNGHGLDVKSENYLFSGGDSSRDYATLLEAVRELDIPVVIASCNPKWKHAAKMLSHVHVEQVSPVRFRKLMASARAVVVPLKMGILQGAGQQTYLNAMELRKPVIISRAPGVLDHVADRETGWVVAAGDVAELRQAIERVFQDGTVVQKVAEAGATCVSQRFTLDHFVDRHLALARSCIRKEALP